MKITENRLKEIIAEEVGRTTQQIRDDLGGNFSAVTAKTVADALIDLTHVVDSQSGASVRDPQLRPRLDEATLKKIIAEELSRVISEMENPSMPSEFVQGSGSAFIDSPHRGVRAVADQAEYGEDSAPEDLVAVAMAARAAEIMDPDGKSDNVEVKVHPRVFRNRAIQIVKDYVIGKSGDRNANLRDIITRISVDYFDEDIQDVINYVTAPRSPAPEGHPYDYPPGQEGRFTYV